MKSLFDFEFYHKLMVRSSAKPYSDFKYENLKYLLLDPEFQKALLLASIDLYKELEKLNFDFDLMNCSLRTTVFKYYNRISYRPTPFGAFASVSMLSWGGKGTLMMRESMQSLLSFPDFKEYGKKFESSEKVYLYTNPSLYKVGDDYRYLCRCTNNGAKGDSFSIVKIPKSPLLKKLFSFLTKPASYPILVNFVETTLAQVNAAEVIDKLVNNQTLYHTNLPTITKVVFPTLTEHTVQKKNCYTIAYHKQTGTLSQQYQKDILDGMFALERLIPGTTNYNLSRFARKYSERFSTASMPLLKALDPQVGISYLDTEKGILRQDGDVGFQSEKNRLEQVISWTASRKLLLNKLTEISGEKHNTLLFSELELSELESSRDQNLPFPSSLPVMFRLHGDFVFMESTGGCSATGIAGRFSHDDAIFNALKNVTSLEQERNPGVLFAELASIEHSIIDNINTRRQLRDYEIPVLVHSDYPIENRISLADLYVCVVNGKIVLYSRSLKKEIIPRLSSAYNYNLSNLPLMRFLGDLQFQSIDHNFSFDPEQFVPGMSHYPRMIYKNCILSVEKWIWNDQVLKNLSGHDGLENLREMSLTQGLPRFFMLCEHDRELVFDLENEMSLHYFLTMIKNRKRIVLKECLLPEAKQAITDEYGKLYCGQLIAFLINRQPVFNGVTNFIQDSVKKKVHLPGGDWSYFKIYGHLESLNMFLRDPSLLNLIDDFKKNGGIRCWFFIRYSDPEPHLRIRFKLTKVFSTVITNQFSLLVKKFLQNGLLIDFNVSTYEPERARYATFGMKRIEKLFQMSSEVVLTFQSTIKSAVQETYFAFGSLAMILTCFVESPKDKLRLVTQVLANLNIVDKHRKQLDQYYREHSKELSNIGSDPRQYYQGDRKEKLDKLANKCVELRRSCLVQGNFAQFQLIVDVIHMHLNRVNASGSLILEAATYYLMKKYLRSVLFRERSVLAISSAKGICT